MQPEDLSDGGIIPSVGSSRHDEQIPTASTAHDRYCTLAPRLKVI